MKKLFASSILTLALLAMPGFSQPKKTKDAASAPQTTQSSSVAPAAKEKAHKGGPSQNASAAQIADAKANGLVWVNTVTGVYHKDGQYFGATKEGKFMSEGDAKKGGSRSAKEPAQAARAPKAANPGK